MSAAEAPSVDGRRARAERNRDAVVEAILDLLREGIESPNVSEIAERSGVSVRSVFRHFDDLESLHIAAIEVHLQQVWHLFAVELPEGPVELRVAALVEQRARLYEDIAPIRRVAERRRRTSPAITAKLGVARRFLRNQVRQCFTPELSRRGGSTADDLLDALELAAGWSSWETLRTEQGLSVARAKRVLGLSLTCLVD